MDSAEHGKRSRRNEPVVVTQIKHVALEGFGAALAERLRFLEGMSPPPLSLKVRCM